MLTMAVSVAFMLSCGGGKSKVETSPEMQEFMDMIKGSHENVSTALAKFAVENLQNHDITMYDLKNATAVAKEGNCYTMEAEAGVTTRVYKICWNGNKITSIEFVEMK